MIEEELTMWAMRYLAFSGNLSPDFFIKEWKLNESLAREISSYLFAEFTAVYEEKKAKQLANVCLQKIIKISQMEKK